MLVAATACCDVLQKRCGFAQLATLPRRRSAACPPRSAHVLHRWPQHAHLCGLNLAVAQHLGDQAADERLALVCGAAEAGQPVAVPHRKHLAAVLRGVKAAAAAGVGCTWGAVKRGL